MLRHAVEKALSERFTLFPPVPALAIEREEAEYGGPLPGEYVELLRISDGMFTAGRLSLLSAEGVVQRNVGYEVQTYLPGKFMIGDDSGGRGILLNLQDHRIYEVDLGTLDDESIELSANSLDELLTLSTCLAEREGRTRVHTCGMVRI